MVAIVKSLTNKLYVAVSGGVDSMSLLHLLARKHQVTALHYVHSLSDTSNAELLFVEQVCKDIHIPLIVRNQTVIKPKDQSKEEFWRNGRLEFFKSMDAPVAIGTTLDDAVEWYVFSMMHGLGKFVEYSNENIIRPFLLTKKSDLYRYAEKHSVQFIEDHTNNDPSFAVRNRIRNNIIPEALKVNPGLYTIVKKRLVEKIRENSISLSTQMV